MADKLLKSITFPDLSDRYVIGDPTLSVEGAGADAKATGDALATKANTNGTYDSMTVGNAEQLVSNVRVNDKTPYIFRTSGGSVDIGDREYVNGIVGGTVAWNQLVQNGNFADSSGWAPYNATKASLSVANNTATVSFLSDGAGYTYAVYRSIIHALKESHKYLVTLDMNVTKTGLYAVDVNGNSNGKAFSVSEANVWVWNGFIFTATSNQATSFFIEPVVEITSSDTMKVRNVGMFDLTQMFGSTIADYIYSLETATAGAGVAWFKKLFNKPYYAYDSGTMKHVEGLVSHDMNGFNQWDEEWEVGSYSSTGQKVATQGGRIRSTNMIRVLPNTTYYMSGGVYILCQYDEDENFISFTQLGSDASSNTGHTVTTSANTSFVTFATYQNYGTTYNHDICINLHWDGSRDGEYEPFELHSYPLDSDLTLRGIPKLDANNNLYYDGDTYESDGTVTRKYGTAVLDGSSDEGWDIQNGTFTSYVIGSAIKRSATYGSNIHIIISDKYPSCGVKYRNDQIDMTIMKTVGDNNQIAIKDSTCVDASAFKAKLAANPVTVIYELATPTEESADPYNGTQIVDDFGTEEYILDDSAFPVPVGHDTDYPVNLVAKLEMAPNSPSGDGDYIVRQVNGENSYVPLVIEDALPTVPSTAGSYKLTVTVADGSDPVLAWTQA